MGDKYTKSAHRQDCQIRIPGHCNFDPNKVVFAHLNGGGGGMKHKNIHGSYACSDCHDMVDGRSKTEEFTHDEIKLMFFEGMLRTQLIMIELGILKL